VIRYGDGTSIGVVVRRDNSGKVVADGAEPIGRPDLASPPPFAPPNEGLSQIKTAPAEILSRTPAPLCGEEDAGLAGPFNSEARACFRSAVLNSSAAEFLSLRADVEGRGFTELWRYSGAGPVVVYTMAAGEWKKLTCALLLLDDGHQFFDHTDCQEAPLT
jgi:hypothetical protein